MGYSCYQFMYFNLESWGFIDSKKMIIIKPPDLNKDNTHLEKQRRWIIVIISPLSVTARLTSNGFFFYLLIILRRPLLNPYRTNSFSFTWSSHSKVDKAIFLNIFFLRKHVLMLYYDLFIAYSRHIPILTWFFCYKCWLDNLIVVSSVLNLNDPFICFFFLLLQK